MREKKLDQVQLKGKCVSCGKTAVLTSKQILEGERDGTAISTCCFMPMTIERATFTSSRKKKGG